MNNSKSIAKKRPGFTLLEVIVAVILASIMADHAGAVHEHQPDP